MDIEEHVEASEVSSNDDLRSALESAVRESASREDHSAEPSEAPAANRTAVERARDASGKFAPKPADAPAAVAKPTETAPQQPEGTAPAATRKAPASWSPEHQQSFTALPPAIQDQILKREADVAKGFEERAGKAKAYDELEGIIGPHRESLSRRGMSPGQAINVLLDVQRQFDRDPRDAWLRLGAQFGFVKAPAGSPQQAAQQQPQAPQRPAGPPLEHVVQRTDRERHAAHGHSERDPGFRGRPREQALRRSETCDAAHAPVRPSILPTRGLRRRSVARTRHP